MDAGAHVDVSPGKVLLVDDSDASLKGMRRALEGLGAELFTAPSGERALALIERHEFSVLLLDVHMPGMDGFETAQAIRARTSDLPLIFITGHSEDATPDSVYEAGAVDYLYKPLSPEILCSKVQVFVDLDRQRRALRATLGRLEKANRELERIVWVDPLTGLPNRRGIGDVLAREQAMARCQGAAAAVALVSCDGLARINGALGHGTGDLVLQTVARRLRASLRERDRLARIGGDEFLVLMPATPAKEARRLIRRASAAVAASPILSVPEPVTITVSAGVAALPVDASSTAEALARTRPLVLEAKERGGGCVVGEGRAGVGVSLLEELEQGLRAVAQPIVALPGGEVVGYELLTRGPAGPLASPPRFLELAREQQLLSAADLACLKVTLQAAAGFAHGTHVHVNLFPTTLLDVPVIELERLVSLCPNVQLCVELSEAQFVGDPGELVERLALLRASGVAIAVDDLGAGSGTLDSVVLLEPEIVKIDRALVDGAADDPRKQTLLRRMVTVARAFACEVVAEGVERAEDARLLADLGVTRAQGYLWSQPLELDALPAGARAHALA